jgi:hypothetical protein
MGHHSCDNGSNRFCVNETEDRSAPFINLRLEPLIAVADGFNASRQKSGLGDPNLALFRCAEMAKKREKSF